MMAATFTRSKFAGALLMGCLFMGFSLAMSHGGNVESVNEENETLQQRLEKLEQRVAELEEQLTKPPQIILSQPNIGQPGPAQPAVPKNWKPFEINGMTYFHIPLDSQGYSRAVRTDQPGSGVASKLIRKPTSSPAPVAVQKSPAE